MLSLENPLSESLKLLLFEFRRVPLRLVPGLEPYDPRNLPVVKAKLSILLLVFKPLPKLPPGGANKVLDWDGLSSFLVSFVLLLLNAEGAVSFIIFRLFLWYRFRWLFRLVNSIKRSHITNIICKQKNRWYFNVTIIYVGTCKQISFFFPIRTVVYLWNVFEILCLQSMKHVLLTNHILWKCKIVRILFTARASCEFCYQLNLLVSIVSCIQKE